MGSLDALATSSCLIPPQSRQRKTYTTAREPPTHDELHLLSEQRHAKTKVETVEGHFRRLQTELDRVQTEFGRLEQTCNEQTWEMQQLRLDYRDLKTENDELRKKRKPMIDEPMRILRTRKMFGINGSVIATAKKP